MQCSIRQISASDATDFLLPRHYSRRVTQITIAYGWIFDGLLKAVVTFGKPESDTVCRSLCGDEYRDSVYELNRLCRDNDLVSPINVCIRGIKKT